MADRTAWDYVVENRQMISNLPPDVRDWVLANAKYVLRPIDLQQAIFNYQQTGEKPQDYFTRYSDLLTNTPEGQQSQRSLSFQQQAMLAGYDPGIISQLVNDNNYTSYDDLIRDLKSADPITVLKLDLSGKGYDMEKVNAYIDKNKGKNPEELRKDLIMLYGTPLERMKLALTSSDTADMPKFNDSETKKALDAFIASLEDPYNQSMQSMLENANQRGMLNSGFKDEQLGRLMTGYEGAKAQEANALTGTTANQQINAATQNYNQQVSAYLDELGTLWKDSGQTWDDFYNNNKALIDSKLSGYASDKGIEYANAAADYQSGINNFQDVINNTSSLFRTIGNLGADIYWGATKSNAPLSERINTPYYGGGVEGNTATALSGDYTFPDYSMLSRNPDTSLSTSTRW